MDRTLRWIEHFDDDKDKDDDDDVSEEDVGARAPRMSWQKINTNLPKSAPPAPLKQFSEQEALDELANLQKQREITIKPCDKTGGVAIINTSDYIESM